jgi:CBASS immunity sensor of nucleotide second messenger signals
MKFDKYVHIATSLVQIWLTRRRNTGYGLVWMGGCSTPLSMIFPRLSYNKADGLELIIDGFTFLDAVGPLIILVGLTLIVYEKLKGESSLQHRAKSIDMRSLHGSTAPKLCDDFSAVIDQAGLHNDLYFESKIYTREDKQPASEFLPIITDELHSFANGFLRKARNEPLKPFALGAIAHVPFCFALGFIIGNKSQSNYYCWSRDKKKWIDCRTRPDFGSSAHFTIWQKEGISKNEITSVGMSIEISFTSNEKVFISSNDLNVCVKVSVDNQSVGNIFSDVEQTRIVGQVREYVNNDLRQQFPKLTELHITIMAQASFIMRLGAEFNQNHMPKTYIYHYESNSDDNYPWNLQLTPGIEKIEWNVK